MRDAALAFLLERIDYERQPAAIYGEHSYPLGRMRELLARLGDPHIGLPTVHVAGTKGKGSTAAMIAAALSAAGHSTGLFSSPHLNRVEERFAVDGQPCTEAEFVELVERLRPVALQMDAEAARQQGAGPTYFELTTALALLHFRRRGVAAAVLEVGMGGRLDSTNVVTPAVSVITSISFDHMKQLGHTLAAIAGEKAGIIKPGVPVVSGVTQDEPRVVIERIAAERGSRIMQLGRDFSFTYQPPKHLDAAAALGRIDFTLRNEAGEQSLHGVELGLLGSHQGANAAVVLATLAELRTRGWKLPEEAVRRGLASVRWPARVEVVSRRPVVVIDAAHNGASIEALLTTLDESFLPRRRGLIFATTKEKDLTGMLGQLLPKFDRVIFTRYRNNPRGVPPEELLELDGPSRSHCSVAADPKSAWEAMRLWATPDDLVCVTGSFFIAAEMRSEMTKAEIRMTKE